MFVYISVRNLFVALIYLYHKMLVILSSLRRKFTGTEKIQQDVFKGSSLVLFKLLHNIFTNACVFL